MKLLAALIAVAALSGPADTDWFEFCNKGEGVFEQHEVCRQIRSPASAAEMQTLAGLKGVTLFIERMPPGVVRLGITDKRVYEEVDLALSGRGLRVLRGASGLEGRPVLYVRIHLAPGKGGLAYTIGLLLFQQVSIVATSGDAQPGVTWEADATGFSEAGDPEEVVASLRVVSDYFADDFLAANPRR